MKPVHSRRHWRCTQKSIDVFQVLASAAPKDAQAQRDLAASYLSIGDVHLDNQNLPAAREAFAKSLAVFQAQGTAAPTDVQAQRDLAVAHLKQGYVEQQAGLPAAATTAYQSSLEIFSRIAAAAPEDVQAQRDLAIAHQSLGDARLQAGAAAEAEASFEASLKITSRLATAAPTDAQAQSDWMTSLVRLAHADRTAYRYKAAKERFAEGSGVLKRFVESTGRNPFDADLKLLDANLRHAETAAEVVAHLEHSLSQPAAEIPGWLRLRINAKLDEARQPDQLLPALEEVARTAATLGALVPGDKSNWHGATLGYARAVRELDDAKGREATSGTPAIAHSAAAQTARARYLTSALHALRETLRAGWTDTAALRNDPELRSMKNEPEFKTLVGPLEGK